MGEGTKESLPCFRQQKLLLSVLGGIFIGRVAKHLREQLKGRKYGFWLTVSEGPVNRGGEGMVEQNTPHRQVVQKGDGTYVRTTNLAGTAYGE